jgi:threonine/homoserine/homoserine lactone efflux protein
VSSTLVLAFLAAAIPSFFSPGPNNLMLMASSAKFGLSRTVPHAFGIIIGFPLMVFGVGLGLGEVFERFPTLHTILKFVAAANLLWIAWTLIGLRIGDVKADERPLRFYEAALFQWVNPKAWGMAISFVAIALGPRGDAMFLLVALTLGCLVLAPFSSIVWMGFGSQLKSILRRTGGERYLGPVMAGLMVLAVILFLI